MRRWALLLSCAVLPLASTIVGVAQQTGTRQGHEDWSAYLPPGEGRDIVVSRCSGCHDLRGTVQLRKPAAGWEAIVLDMGARGAPLTLEEIDPIVKYLSTAFGPNAPPFTDANAASRDELVKLPGVTAEAAERLIKARADGPLVSQEQVRTALAIAPSTFDKFKHYLYVKPPGAKRR
jgi:Helix-hairpin-helix motif